MRDDHENELKNALVFSERIFALSGVWPEKPGNLLFVFTMLYFGQLIVMEFWDVCDHLDNFELLIVSSMEVILTTGIYIVFIMVRCSKQLEPTIVAMKREIADDTIYENNEEKRLYLGYNSVSYKVSKYIVMSSMTTLVLQYLRPLIHLLAASHLDNSTIPYQLPFRAHIFFDYKEPRIYGLVYLCLCPVIYLGVFHVSEIGLIFTLVMHVCAKYAILAYRIRNMSTMSVECFNNGIKKIVESHLQLKELKIIEKNVKRNSIQDNLGITGAKIQSITGVSRLEEYKFILTKII
ncbi:uncharacterized protein LOC143153653 [Ptiloglossa arizonensis]|uniref:uncharacterized protein LOC143153653 n=1 Tax=Ptiloglossa arizonensis TaxID=3350558 RepID=UPI003F9FD8D5